MNWRAKLVQDLTGVVLEVGVGSGANLPYYRRAERVWAIEPDPARAAVAQRVGDHARVPVQVRTAAAEALPFDDAAFDHIVSSLVFCSVSEPQRALAEIGRVLKPGGTLHMVEHVRPQSSCLAALFSTVTPAWSRIAHNCHLDRPTVELLRGSGWQVEVLRTRFVFVKLRATLEGQPSRLPAWTGARPAPAPDD